MTNALHAVRLHDPWCCGVARCAMHVSHAACGVDLLESALTVPYLPSLSGSCEIGFSHSTALPASKHATTCCRTTAPPKRSQPSKAHESGCFHAAAAWKLNVKINLKMRLRCYHERLARTWVLNSQWPGPRSPTQLGDTDLVVCVRGGGDNDRVDRVVFQRIGQIR